MKAGLMSRSFKFHSKWQPHAAGAGCSGSRMYWDFEVGLWHTSVIQPHRSNHVSSRRRMRPVAIP